MVATQGQRSLFHFENLFCSAQSTLNILCSEFVVFCSEYWNIFATATKPLYSGRKAEASCSSTWWSVFFSWVERRSLSVCSLTQQNLYTTVEGKLKFSVSIGSCWNKTPETEHPTIIFDRSTKDGVVCCSFSVHMWILVDDFVRFHVDEEVKLQHTADNIFKGVPGRKYSNLRCLVLLSISAIHLFLYRQFLESRLEA